MIKVLLFILCVQFLFTADQVKKKLTEKFQVYIDLSTTSSLRMTPRNHLHLHRQHHLWTQKPQS